MFVCVSRWAACKCEILGPNAREVSFGGITFCEHVCEGFAMKIHVGRDYILYDVNGSLGLM